ncbi:MAG: TolC family protein, partial [Kofleriaceae bacterium]
MNRPVGLVLILAALAAAPATAHAAPARSLTLMQAIEVALSHNPQLAIEAESIIVADAHERADAKLRLPLLGVKANVLFWDRSIVGDLGPPIGQVTFRERVTGSLDLQVSQPISGALVIGTLVERDRALTAASRAQRDGARVDIAYQTAAAYLSALQAKTLGGVATATLQKLDGDLQHARLLVQAGTLQAVDVLRLEVERARIEQQGLEAETAALEASRRLALLLGLPDGSELALIDIDTSPPALAWTEDEAVLRARRDRADAHAAEANRRAAELGVSVTRASYYPSLSLVGVYSHAITSGSFGSASDSAYLGVSLDWNLWDWGKRAAEVDGARAQSRQASIAQGALGEQIAVSAR